MYEMIYARRKVWALVTLQALSVGHQIISHQRSSEEKSMVSCD